MARRPAATGPPDSRERPLCGGPGSGALRRGAGALLALALLLPAVLAHEGDGRPHVQFFQEFRRPIAVSGGGALGVDLVRESNPLRDSVLFRLDAEAGILLFQYRSEPADPQTSFGLRIRFLEVLEYSDANGNERFDAGIDGVQERLPFERLRWEVGRNRTVYQGEHKIEYLTAKGTHRDFQLGFEVLAAGRQMQIGEERMHPQDVKFNFNFVNWTFRGPQTRLAFLLEVWTPARASLRAEENADGVTTGIVFSTPTRMGFFAWAGVAVVDRQRKIIQATVADRGEPDNGGFVRSVIMNYPQGRYVSHDPVVGVEYVTSAPPPLLGIPTWVFGLAGLLLAGGTGGAIWWRRRRGPAGPPGADGDGEAGTGSAVGPDVPARPATPERLRRRG